jgi:hypothetical protein
MASHGWGRSMLPPLPIGNQVAIRQAQGAYWAAAIAYGMLSLSKHSRSSGCLGLRLIALPPLFELGVAQGLQ